MLGIDGETGYLRTVNDFSYMLAGIVYDFRAIGVKALLPADIRGRQHKSARKHFEEQRRLYLIDENHSVVFELLSRSSYGIKAAHQHLNTAVAFWAKKDKKQYMEYCGKRVRLDKFRDVIDGSITDAEKML